MTPTLAPLSDQDMVEVRGLRPHPDQEKFCGTGAEIVADPAPAVDLHVIRQNDVAVGLFKVDRDYADGAEFDGPGTWGLRGVMIDARYQGRGIGKAVFAALPAYLRRIYPSLGRICLTVNCRNPAARHVYLTGGWVDTGRLFLGGIAGPQHILRLDLLPARVGV